LVASALCACASGGTSPGYTVTVAPPPPPVVENPIPRPGFVWAPGYWSWQGNSHVWVEGHWLPARDGERWIADHWSAQNGRWRFEPGHWEQASAEGETSVLR